MGFLDRRERPAPQAGPWFFPIRDESTHHLVSITVSGDKAASGHSPAVSASGRYAAFISSDPNVMGGAQEEIAQLYVVDLDDGEVTRITESPHGEPGDGPVRDGVAFAGDSHIVFSSFAGNLATAADLNATSDVFVREIAGDQLTYLVFRGTDEQQTDAPSLSPAISADGRYVAFVSTGSFDGAPAGGFVERVYFRDRRLGTTTQISVDSLERQANAASDQPAMPSSG